MSVNSKMPKGISYIIGNELAERFSFYGMKTILMIFMTQHLLGSTGEKEVMANGEAKVYYHLFVMFTYLLPIAGSFLADIFWGKYKTIIILSFVYCAGHIALAMDETRLGLSLGLTMIAIGSGGIKPSVSAHVGDQFTKENSHLMSKVFSWFYFSINLGSFISSLLTPWLLEHYGPGLAFGVPGALMIVATFVFWLGRKTYTSVPPVGWKAYKEFLFTKEGGKVVFNLLIIYLFVSVFWSLFDQTGSAWVQQANSPLMDKKIHFLNIEMLPSQITAVNALLILVFIPLFNYVIYPFINKYMEVTPMRKIFIGLILASFSFVIVGMAESRMARGETVSIMWQLSAYVVLTAAEVLVSITALEFAYTQAPKSLKSFIMSFYLLSVFLGNFITALVNIFIMNEDGSSKLEGSSYYYFFFWMMLVVGILFFIPMRLYKTKEYVEN